MIKSFLRTWQFIAEHPLASRNRKVAIGNWVKWQVGSSILKMPVIFPWIGDSKLIAERGMTGATGNIYAGLHEFADMAFCLHLLRPGDVFVDVGANIGSYTVLASKIVGANSISFEPVPQTFKHLQDNIKINNISNLVDANCCAVGAVSRSIKFSCDQDTTNQVVDDDYAGQWIDVPVKTLDKILQNLEPIFIKIDVEGYEPEVIRGAKETLQKESLLAILLETVDFEIENILREAGFISASYDPFTKTILTSACHKNENNCLWIKDNFKIVDRCQSAPKYESLGITF